MGTPIHIASRVVVGRVPEVFAFLSDIRLLGTWALGSMNTEAVSDGLWRGTSLFSGASTYIRIEQLPEIGLIRYFVGNELRQEPRILALVHPVDDIHVSFGLVAFRTGDMTDAQWEKLARTHETEADLIVAHLESER